MRPAEDTLQLATREFRPATLRGNEGFFRAGQDHAGRWWMLDPAGRPFFCRAVHGVRVAPPQQDDAALPRDSAARLRAWGFNAIGVGGDDAVRQDGLAFLAAVEFCAAGTAIVTAPGVRLPDVFDPEWPLRVASRAVEACAPLASCRELLGWVTDSQLGWGQPGAVARPTLLQVCLSLEPAFAAYHAAWEFVLALHGGQLDALARAWAVPIANKEVVRTMTRADTGIASRGYLRDEARWTREFARRYFTTATRAIRAADPNHLVFGCRFAGLSHSEPGLAGGSVLAECVYPAVDVAMPNWRELPPGGAVPMLAGDINWTDADFQRSTSARDRRITSVERMLRRGRVALERLAIQPAVVGYIWREWEDTPGEQPPFARGLVHVGGAEAREHTELLTIFNRRAETLRHSAADALSS